MFFIIFHFLNELFDRLSVCRFPKISSGLSGKRLKTHTRTEQTTRAGILGEKNDNNLCKETHKVSLSVIPPKGQEL